jgi:O-antigen/teichoic acid export membrane protein
LIGQAVVTDIESDTHGMTRDSIIMMAGGFFVGFFVYIYQLAMGILLTPADYGTLLGLTSLFGILSVFAQVVSFTTARATSIFKSEGRLTAVTGLWRASGKLTLSIGLVSFLILCSLAPLTARFMGISGYSNVILVFSTMLFVFPLYSNWGIIQGLQKFTSLSMSQALWSFFRPALALIFVYLSLGLKGGLLALPLSYGLTLVITHFSLRNLPDDRTEKVRLKTLISYSSLTLLALFAITTLTNIDVVLAKHYLNPADAGVYSTISVLGRIAFMAPMGIATAMFPRTTAAWARADGHRHLLSRAVALTFLIVSVICLIYALFPTQITGTLFSGKYISVAPYLLKYTLGMSSFALFYIVLVYFLSLGQTRVTFAAVFMMMVQVGLIVSFHAGISQLVNIMLISGVLSSVVTVPLLFWHPHMAAKVRL